MYWLKDFWATAYFDDVDYYEPSFLYFNVPLYITGWLGSVYFNGGYDEPRDIKKLIKGLVFGSILLAAIYGFLPLNYRTSRMLLLLGSVWAIISTFSLRFILHFIKNKNFKVGQSPIPNLIIIGESTEATRVLDLLKKANIQQNFIGVVAPESTDNATYLSHLANLKEVVQIYQVDEIIFCSKDISAQSIMHWMTQLGNRFNYKIVPKETMSIIGSNSKNTSGELYTVDIRYKITDAVQRRSKRLVDLLLAILLGLTFPLSCLFVNQKLGFFNNIIQVVLGNKTWVGYATTQTANKNLPFLKKGILSPLAGLNNSQLEEATIQRLNFFYARDYNWEKDIALLWKGFSHLGNKQ